MSERFTFEEGKHQYKLDGKPLTGVTTILGVLAKPALIPWAAKMVTEWIKENCDKEEGFYAVSEEQLEEAKSAHRKKKESAGDIGTAVHKWIENWIKDCTIPYPEDTQQCTMVSHFTKWANDNNVIFLESEKRLYSEKEGFAGTVDFVCKIEDKVWLGDIKTASGIYPENFSQMAGYQIMLEEMGLYKDVIGHVVVNLKKDGKFEEKRSVSLEDSKKLFMACLDIYRSQEKIKNNII